ncbi:ABC transporter substrate-binding protein [Actinomadura fibrosa]|uniref:ABC transporter substrate-binding protein n=1 Tax=Actinomadura fibrosa TaxID=111802 RepID=A0ABW2Y7Q8_9ACTN|nr:ABC transporter substrate-binding protein [Actinomadura fibrosa]
MNRRNFLVSTAGMVVTGLVAACGGNAAQGGGTSSDGRKVVNVGVTPLLNAAPLYLGIKKGFFGQEGLAVTAKTIQTAATAIPSMLKGELQYALVSTVPAINARAQGLQISMVLGNDVYAQKAEDDGSAFLVAKDSRIKSSADLAGTTIGIVGLRSMPELAARQAMRKAGADPDSAKFVELPYAEMISGVKQGRVDAALAADPFLGQGLDQGLRAAGSPYSEAFPAVTGLSWIGAGQYLKGDSDAVQRFVRAMTKSVQYCAEHPDEVRAQAGTFTKISAAALPKVRLPVFSPRLDQAQLQKIADAMVAEKFVTKRPDLGGLVLS